MRIANCSWLPVFSLYLFCGAAVAQDGFYVLGAVGNSSSGVNFDAGTDGLRTQVDDGDFSFKLGGGYQFTRRLSLEAAYEDFGDLVGQNQLDCNLSLPCPLVLFSPTAGIEATALSLSVVGSFAIKSRLDGYGKLGLTGWEFDGPVSTIKDSGTDAHYGVGLRWSLNTNWKIFADYTRIDLDLSAVSLGVTCRL